MATEHRPRSGGPPQALAREAAHRDAVLAHLATKFEPGAEYSEREVNDVLLRWHTFRDWAMLRRELYDCGYLDRERDGSRYRLASSQPARTDGTAEVS